MCFGVTVPYKVWKTAIESKTSTLFVRRLATAVWDESLLVSLAVNIEKTAEPLQRVSVRETARQFIAFRRESNLSHQEAGPYYLATFSYLIF